MSMLDSYSGTRAPRPGVVPVPSVTLKAALLQVARDSAPFVVRDGAPEGTDIIAEWRLSEPRWQGIFASASLSRVTRLYLLLDENQKTVKALDEEHSVAWANGTPHLALATGMPLGPLSAAPGGVGFTEQAAPGVVNTFHFVTAEMREPLAQVISDLGWRVEGVVSKSSVTRSGMLPSGIAPYASTVGPEGPSTAPMGGALALASPVAFQPLGQQGSGMVIRSTNTIIAPRNGMATAGFVCALHGLVPFWIGFVLCVLGIVFSSIGLSRAKELNGAGKGLAIAGLVLALVFVIPAMFGL